MILLNISNERGFGRESIRRRETSPTAAGVDQIYVVAIASSTPR